MNRTMDAKITKLERESDRMAIVPPTELTHYLQGKKAETEEENIKILQIYDRWLAKIKRVLSRATDASQQEKIVREILNSLPEPWRTRVVEALRKLAAKRKEPMK